MNWAVPNQKSSENSTKEMQQGNFYNTITEVNNNIKKKMEAVRKTSTIPTTSTSLPVCVANLQLLS